MVRWDKQRNIDRLYNGEYYTNNIATKINERTDAQMFECSKNDRKRMKDGGR